MNEELIFTRIIVLTADEKLDIIQKYPLYIFAVNEWGIYASKDVDQTETLYKDLILQYLNNEPAMKSAAQFGGISPTFLIDLEMYSGKYLGDSWENYVNKILTHAKVVGFSGIGLATIFGLKSIVSHLLQTG